MPCKLLGKQRGWMPTVWFGCAEAQKNLTVEYEMEFHAGGACVYV